MKKISIVVAILCVGAMFVSAKQPKLVAPREITSNTPFPRQTHGEVMAVIDYEQANKELDMLKEALKNRMVNQFTNKEQVVCRHVNVILESMTKEKEAQKATPLGPSVRDHVLKEIHNSYKEFLNTQVKNDAEKDRAVTKWRDELAYELDVLNSVDKILYQSLVYLFTDPRLPKEVRL